jgi:hypothetical protein
MASTTDRFGAKRQEPEETGQVTNRANPYSYQRTGDDQMTRKSDIAVNALTGIYPSMAAAEIRLQQQREQTLEWIATNALSTYRGAWCRAKSVDSGIDCATGSPTSAE